jgi:BirA family biotin operon repressor/biotin-[acetyl-CoA-carboxylase] ligase
LFPQTFANHTPITPFIVLSITESTNNYAMAKLHAGMVQYVTCFLATEQTQGRGQRGKIWISNPGDNITMSAAFPLSGRVSANVTAFPFVLSASMALGCYDFIKDCGLPDLYIKWPNDIYVGDRKAAGILIENVYRGSTWEWAVVGTGVNLNQIDFPAEAGKAISLKMITGFHYNPVHLGRSLFSFLIQRFEKLKDESAEAIIAEYNSRLYKKNQTIKLKKGNIVFPALVKQVNEAGQLVIQAATEQSFNVGEVEFV